MRTLWPCVRLAGVGDYHRSMNAASIRPTTARRLARLLFLVFACLAGLGAGTLRAQLIAAADPSAADVKIELVEFGVGNAARAGEWTGLRLRLTDSSPRQREVLLRVLLSDADGDRPAYSRVVTLNPGVPQDAWLYLRLPFWFRQGDPVTVEVNEIIEDSGQTLGVRPGALISRQALLSTGRVGPAHAGLIGVIGAAELGLRQFAQVSTSGINPWPALAHESLEPISGLSVRHLPDRWTGLAQFPLIVWSESSGGGEFDVSQLRGERTRALREWVRRGGHLVIVLPPVGQAWTNAATNELLDLLPAVRIERDENAEIEALRPLLTRSEEVALPRRGVLHFFEPFPDAGPGEAVRVLNAPDGRCVVARRLVGLGAVTLIGIDLSPRVVAQGGSIDADVFWHRVLGTRGLLSPTPRDVVARGPEIPIDRGISSEIAKRGTAATGVLLGVVLFTIYWALAGPVLFGLLKRFDLTRHAWVAFVGVALAFSAAAFGLAHWARPARFEATQLSVIDHVHGQNVQRVRSWMSVMIPENGRVRLVAPDQEGGLSKESGRRELGGVLSPWDPVGADQRSGFLDAQEYTVDGRDPVELRVPARSTVKQVQLDWAGAPVWKMPRPVESAPLRLESGRLVGQIVHELPGALSDVLLAVVIGQQPIGADVRSRLVSRVQFWRLAEDWDSGAVLDLAGVTAQAPSSNAGELWLANLVPVSGMTLGGQAAGESRFTRNWTDAVAAFSLYNQLGIPEDARGSSGQSVAVLRREATHGLDLGRWFTQPCIIVIARLDQSDRPDSGAPVGLFHDDNPIDRAGSTVVRWIYPLASQPPSTLDAAAPGSP